VLSGRDVSRGRRADGGGGLQGDGGRGDSISTGLVVGLDIGGRNDGLGWGGDDCLSELVERYSNIVHSEVNNRNNKHVRTPAPVTVVR
jgi:hypothetical protein